MKNTMLVVFLAGVMHRYYSANAFGPPPDPNVPNTPRSDVNVSSSACQREQSNFGLPGSFVPKCAPDGTYEERQCDTITMYCWCVEPTSGIEVEGTRKAPVEGEVTCEKCGTRICPVTSKCVRTRNHTACRCNSRGYIGRGNKCIYSKQIYKSEVRLDDAYLPTYANKSSRAFVEKATLIETTLLAILQKEVPAVVGVEVTELTPGSIVVQFLIIMNETMKFSNASLLATTIYDAAIGNNNQLGLFNVSAGFKPPNMAELLTTQTPNTTKGAPTTRRITRGSTTCEPVCREHERCVNGTSSYICQCVQDYKRNSSGSCYKYSSNGGTIQRPILTYMLVILTFVLLLQRWK